MTTYDEALSAVYSWYYPRVRRLVDEAIAACKTERPVNVSREQFLTDWVNKASDSCGLVIYNEHASMVLAASNNADAYSYEFEEHGSLNWRAMYALRADMWEALDARKEEWE